MKTIKLQPVEGRYGTVIPGVSPTKGAGTLMSTAELTRCVDSDDIRFSNNWPAGSLAYQQFRFDFTGHSPATIKRLRAFHEGHSITVLPFTYLHVWPDNGVPFSLGSHTWAVDKVISYTKSSAFEDWIDGADMLWLLVRGAPSGLSDPGTLYTDQVGVAIDLPSLVEAVSPFGQRYRLYDDLEAGGISFQRQDMPGGEWNTPTQPFTGSGNHSPALEWLPNGLLRAAYIDSGDALQRRISRDDGATWVTP